MTNIPSKEDIMCAKGMLYGVMGLASMIPFIEDTIPEPIGYMFLSITGISLFSEYIMTHINPYEESKFSDEEIEEFSNSPTLRDIIRETPIEEITSNHASTYQYKDL